MTDQPCPRCSNPLPLDGHCDCAGSDIDSRRLKALHYSQIVLKTMRCTICGDSIRNVNTDLCPSCTYELTLQMETRARA